MAELQLQGGIYKSEIEVKEYTVAFLDILGFKSKIETLDLGLLALKYEQLIVQTDANNRPNLEFKD